MPPALLRLGHLFRYELALALRRRGALVMSLGFYLLLTGLAPFIVGPEPALLGAIGGGLLWLFFLLTICLSLERLVAADRIDGTLAQTLLSGTPAFILGLGKAGGLWLTCALPLLLVTPLAGLLLHLTPSANLALVLSLLAGSPALCLTATLAAALTAAARREAVLLPLLLLPLYVPILILGAAAPAAAMAGLGTQGPLLWLLALSFAALAAFPILIGYSLRASV